MSGETILVVDDERNIRSLLRMYLEAEGFRVEEVADGEAALERLETPPLPALLILDLMLPKIDGWEICRRVRGGPQQELPILMLTARDDDIDKIIGLELGADDYVTKPFNPREIVSRVKAILRRTLRTENSAAPIILGDLVIDPQRRSAFQAGAPLDLRRKEFDLLYTLSRQREIVLTREQLLEQVWGYDFAGQTRTVDVHVAALRRKLTGSRLQIETVTGIGYKLTLVRG